MAVIVTNDSWNDDTGFLLTSLVPTFTPIFSSLAVGRRYITELSIAVVVAGKIIGLLALLS